MGNKLMNEWKYITSAIPVNMDSRLNGNGKALLNFSKWILPLVFLAFLLSIPLYGADSQSSESTVSEKIPRMKEKVSVPTAMILDLAPGGGHFYLGNYGYGATFGLLKIGAAASTWYFYSDWQDSKSKYHRAPADKAGSFKQQSDRAAQRMTFSVIGCVVIQAASWLKVYSDCQDRNVDTYPVFDIGFHDDNISGSSAMVFIGMSRRF
jgi:hypothetical protein